MSATILRLPFTVDNPSGLVLSTDPINTSRTLLIHDFSVAATYSGASPVADGTEFANLAVGGNGIAGFVSVQSSVIKTGNYLDMSGNPAGVTSDYCFWGATSAPFPIWSFAGQQSDLLVVVWVRITDLDDSGIIMRIEGDTGANSNLRSLTNLQISGGGVIGFGAGRQHNGGAVQEATWCQLAIYTRCEGYASQTGLVRMYLDGETLGTDVTSSVPSAFQAQSNDKDTRINDQYGGVGMRFGRIAILSGLAGNGFDPDAIVAADYAALSSVFTD